MYIRFDHPMKKMSLCEALHGRAAMARVGAPWPAMGAHRRGEGGGRGRGERRQGHTAGVLGR
jgi:hypothetical protein